TTAGERPGLSIPARVWQGSETTGEWSLVGATMAPGFRSEMFELGHRDDLMRRYPNATTEIARLTRVV
ncbi:MAG: cupin domain-containing protein, partial [Acidimicrobiia bacterium]